ncbi:DUF4767 domain-containing protein [Leuconostoc gasicomitatum]|uniref:DUF4767 domain-containing protein n=1 Tax=Leuconostoc gasicomitatum TaxID=115778 RepID=UPI001CC47080|nr:DUF4767 domain-containing protein [Leuconostoc gasicomitatum]MBZ5946457.1 DUF4767 domain-containing protein [Leuconostoc gasicomitatum]MBZ5954256.1 DUF4767 domain-containing protein [Leuconostoc gasicomitatum]
MTSKQRNSILILSTIVAIFVIVGVVYKQSKSTDQAQHNTSKATTSAQLKSSSLKSSSSSSSNATITNSSSNNDTNTSASSNNSTKATWSADKQNKLSSFMSAWQSKMDQSFVGTYDGQEPNYYGITFPTDLTNGKYNNHVKFDEVTTAVTWSPDGSGESANKVVAIASGKVSKNNFNMALYFFVIQNNQPKVYISRTTNGDDLYFSETQNNDLKSGFANIFNN